MQRKNQPFGFFKKPLVILIGALCCGAYAQAASFTWQGSATGHWHDAVNWDNGVPNADSTATISGGPTVNVTQPTDLVKYFYANDATLNINAGGVLALEQLNLGHEANTKTTVLVSGIGSAINSGADFAVWRIGNSGEAVITLENGGQLTSNGAASPPILQLGENAGASGTIIADGAALDVLGNKIAAIDINALMRVGQWGNGSLQILNGALANIGIVHVGHYAGSQGSVVISGQGSTLNTVKEIVVGHGGTGTLVLENGGVMNIGASSQVNGSIDSWALVTGPSSVWNANGGFVLNTAVRPDVQHRLDIRNGGTINSKGVFEISVFTTESEGILTVADRGSVLNVTDDPVSGGGMYIGSGSKGTMQITNQGEVNSVNVMVGTNATGAGEILVSDAGSRWINDKQMLLGRRGQATMVVQHQGYVESGSSSVGVFADAKGEVLLTGGASWNNLGDMTLGDAGSGILTLNRNAELTVGGVLNIGAQVGGEGTLNVGSALGYAATDAGTLNLSSIVLGNVDSSGVNTGGDGTIVFNHTHSGYNFNANTSGDGSVIVQSGTTRFNGQNTYAGITEIHSQGIARAGGENTFSSNADYQIDAGGWLDMASHNQTLGNTTNAGLITFHTDANANGSGHNLLTVNGDYHGDNGTIVYNTALASNDAPTDLLVVTGNTSGTTHVKVVNAGGTGAETQDGIKLVDVRGDSSGRFNLEGRAVAGAYEYFLYQGGMTTPTDGDWYLRSTFDSPTATPSIYRPEAGGYMANMAAAGNLFSLRLEDREGRAENSSLWLRQVGSRTKHRDSTGQLRTATNSYVIQGGGEVFGTQFTDSDRFGLGVMAAYGQADSKSGSKLTGYRADSRIDGYSTGIYGTWYQDAKTLNGAYVDSWVQYSWLDAEVNGQSVAKESYDMDGFSASIEAGYRLPVYQGLNSEVFITPQAQVVWSGIKADDHREANGTKVSSSGSDNVQTRLGVKISRDGVSDKDIGRDKLFTVYAEANWLNNSQQAGAIMDGVQVKQAGSRNIGELKLGTEGKLNQNLNLWTNVGQQLGDKGYSDTSVNFGIKYSF
ncbi:autotransporter family protein [Budvicia aquatica]|uniref:autotransporter family protein n=1 Tax=Budvicia aquatica TaxID=82979 RepID=UPI00207F1676|nr:autotransporter outer membrane beta-barrel domain-containing protein [Budvicia aquatica]GKX53871.1 autotransporter [Budvicia aquatica]